MRGLPFQRFIDNMFGNENDRPYEFDVDTASTATMAYVIGRLRGATELSPVPVR